MDDAAANQNQVHKDILFYRLVCCNLIFDRCQNSFDAHKKHEADQNTCHDITRQVIHDEQADGDAECNMGGNKQIFPPLDVAPGFAYEKESQHPAETGKQGNRFFNTDQHNHERQSQNRAAESGNAFDRRCGKNNDISVDPERQKIAASKFAGYSTSQIRDIVIPVLEGNIREIISQTVFEDLIRGDKKIFAERIQENVTPNLADMGIDLTTFNIQNFSDKNGVIHDLGIENIEKIKKEASIAAAKAKAEVAVAQAKADQEANDAKVAAATEIAR